MLYFLEGEVTGAFGAPYRLGWCVMLRIEYNNVFPEYREQRVIMADDRIDCAAEMAIVEPLPDPMPPPHEGGTP